MNEQRILIVDDEEDICEILKFNLEHEMFVVDTANSAEEALTLDLSAYHLLLLDVMMGEMSGFKLASMLRKEKKTANLPIIFITAKDTENDMLTGFNLGADDYISKPFSVRQVVMRVKAVLRRAHPAGEDLHKKLIYKGLTLDVSRVMLFIEEHIVSVSKKEFEILVLLMEHRGRVFSREEILARVWTDEVYVLDRTVDVNITRLRKKMRNYGHCIVTRSGYGYCFEEN